MPKKIIAIGGDHAGFSHKLELSPFLVEKGYEVKDFGPHSDVVVDYPDFVHPLCQAIESGEADFGVLICGSGIGVSIAANRHKGIRAALVHHTELAEVTRRHNDANVLCLGARFTTVYHSKMILETFLNAPFDGGIHIPRLEKLTC
jgi:ribose 5-phosphate isomerase B